MAPIVANTRFGHSSCFLESRTRFSSQILKRPYSYLQIKIRYRPNITEIKRCIFITFSANFNIRFSLVPGSFRGRLAGLIEPRYSTWTIKKWTARLYNNVCPTNMLLMNIFYIWWPDGPIKSVDLGDVALPTRGVQTFSIGWRHIICIRLKTILMTKMKLDTNAI